MVFKKIEPGIWKPEEAGESLTGTLIAVDQNVGKFGSTVYNLIVEDGQMAVWGSAVLDRKMTYTKVGDKVRITYKGKEPSKHGEDTKIFDVEVDQ